MKLLRIIADVGLIAAVVIETFVLINLYSIIANQNEVIKRLMDYVISGCPVSQ